MNARICLLRWLCIAFAVVLLAPIASHGAGDTMTYQGVLVEDSGAPIADGSYAFRFDLFDSASAGTLRWTENKFNIPVTSGVFTVELGTTNPFDDLFADFPALFLQVGVNLGGGLQTYGPRVELSSAPYAFDALSLSGLTAPELVDEVRNSFAGAGVNSTISGGTGNIASGQYATIGGGEDNEALAPYATIGGGGPGAQANRVVDEYGTIGGGQGNQAGTDDGDIDQQRWATVSGGVGNVAGGRGAAIPGGSGNLAEGHFSFAGGVSSEALADYSFAYGFAALAQGEGAVALGSFTEALGDGSFASGQDTEAIGDYSFAAGRNSEALGNYSFAMGRNARANQGAFSWADSTGASFTAGVDQFFARASRGYFMATNATASIGAFLGPNSGSWVALSDRALKENVEAIDPAEVLEKVAAMPITQWSYKGGEDVRHMGPMGQDFYAAFGLGTDEKGIATIDADGVALAAIQGLNAKLEARDARIAELERKLDSVMEKLNQSSESK